jgi:uncharacterized membrane protein YtjA (UPF0391 family)
MRWGGPGVLGSRNSYPGTPGPTAQRMGATMLRWALIFLIVALVAALLGFGGIAGAAVGIAKILFVVCLVVFLVLLIAGYVRRPKS